MIPNKECMKAILKFVSENAKVKVDDMAFHNITVSTLNVSMILEQMSKEGSYIQSKRLHITSFNAITTDLLMLI